MASCSERSCFLQSKPGPGPAQGKWGKGIFCYGAKAHPEESAGGELMVSYVANATDFGQVVRDARLYWPRFIRMRWPVPGARTREGG